MLQNSIFKVCKCFNIFYTIFTQVLDKIENFEFPRNAQCLLSASLNRLLISCLMAQLVAHRRMSFFFLLVLYTSGDICHATELYHILSYQTSFHNTCDNLNLVYLFHFHKLLNNKILELFYDTCTSISQLICFESDRVVIGEFRGGSSYYFAFLQPCTNFSGYI